MLNHCLSLHGTHDFFTVHDKLALCAFYFIFFSPISFIRLFLCKDVKLFCFQKEKRLKSRWVLFCNDMLLTRVSLYLRVKFKLKYLVRVISVLFCLLSCSLSNRDAFCSHFGVDKIKCLYFCRFNIGSFANLNNLSCSCLQSSFFYHWVDLYVTFLETRLIKLDH